MDDQAAALRGSAGSGEVVDNLAGAPTEPFGTVAVAVVALVSFPDGLRGRLHPTWPAGAPSNVDMIRSAAEPSWRHF
jgi:hypothetical protein